jgi:hypothetical protein
MIASDLTSDRLALAAFLKELARLLLAAGVSFPQFEKAAQTAFVSAGMDRGRLRNARVNQSAIAAITGISRPTIRAILTGESSESASRNRSRLLSLVYGWTSNPEFLLDSGATRPLPKNGRRSSFQRLVKLYGGDVSAKTLLTELQRLRIVSLRQGRVNLKTSASEKRYVRDLRSLSVALARTLQSPSPASDELHLLVGAGETRYTTPGVVGRVLLKRRIRQGLSAFLTDIESATAVASRATKASRGRKGGRMSKVAVLVVSQD